MDTESKKLTFRERIAARRVQIVALGTTGAMFLVSNVSAAGMNESISPILNDVASLFTPLLGLVLSAIPLVVAIAVIGFVLGILSAILGKLKIS
jgi:hypothetical protein